MAELNLDRDEGIFLESKHVVWISNNQKTRLSRLVLTNKNLFIEYKMNRGLYGLMLENKAHEFVAFPLTDIKAVNGKPLVEQKKSLRYGSILEIQFVHGIESFAFDFAPKDTTTEWVNTLKRVFTTKAGRKEKNVEGKGILSASKSKRFCTQCGAQITVKARFCQKCGTPVEEQGQERESVDESSFYPRERGQVYAGVILRCPSCGASISQSVAVCPDCGHHITAQQAVSSVTSFTRQLLEIELQRKEATRDQQMGLVANPADTQKLALILGFPIPNTIDDIQEFMFLAMANIDVSLSRNTVGNNAKRRMKGMLNVNFTMPRTISDAWVSKMKQAYQKALLLFPDDKAFESIRQLYESKCAELNMSAD
jgi:predicted RNA-binding Zn-ribbon protein involved in translation (DUF1610 family)